MDLQGAGDDTIHPVTLRENRPGLADIGKPPILLSEEPLWKGAGVGSVF